MRECAVWPNSVYRMVQRSLRDKALMNHRQTMSVISYEVENAALVDQAMKHIQKDPVKQALLAPVQPMTP